MRLCVLNPNTNAATTQAMVEIARAAAAPDVAVTGLTAPFGVPLITEPGALAVAADAVAAAVSAADLAGYGGLIVAAFGDPGLDRARALAPCPVTGIAEAGMAEAAAGGRRFAVVTTTPALVGSITATARAYGHAGTFAGVRLTPGDPAVLMADPVRLREALAAACASAASEDRAEAVVIGGGPLARAAAELGPLLPLPVIEPVPAAVRLALRRAAVAG